MEREVLPTTKGLVTAKGLRYCHCCSAKIPEKEKEKQQRRSHHPHTRWMHPVQSLILTEGLGCHGLSNNWTPGLSTVPCWGVSTPNTHRRFMVFPHCGGQWHWVLQTNGGDGCQITVLGSEGWIASGNYGLKFCLLHLPLVTVLRRAEWAANSMWCFRHLRCLVDEN